jgi:hypothetical protein
VPPRHHDVLFRDHRGARRPRTSLIGGRVPRVDRQSRAGGDVVSRQHPYCRRDTDQVVTLIGIAPLSVTGRVRLEGIGVRTTLWGEPDGPSDPDTHMVGIDRGIPAGVRSARGYNVPTCGSPDEPVGEVLVTLTMTAMKAEPLMVCGSHIAPTGGTMPSGAVRIRVVRTRRACAHLFREMTITPSLTPTRRRGRRFPRRPLRSLQVPSFR